MSAAWKPAEYRDEFRARLSKVIETRMRHKGARVEKPRPEDVGEASGKIVDLMAVLRRSLDAAAHQRNRARSTSGVATHDRKARQAQRKRA